MKHLAQQLYEALLGGKNLKHATATVQSFSNCKKGDMFYMYRADYDVPYIEQYEIYSIDKINGVGLEISGINTEDEDLAYTLSFDGEYVYEGGPDSDCIVQLSKWGKDRLIIASLNKDKLMTLYKKHKNKGMLPR